MISSQKKERRIRVLDTDASILTIVETIYRYYEDTSAAVGPLGNIFTVFFHDLVIHFSGI